jgi:hypothetical protein
MSANASTWFYTEPEHDAYLIGERVNHSIWAARMSFLYLDCVSAEPPFRMVGEWEGAPIEIEWEPNKSFALRTHKESPELRRGFSQVLGISPPSLAYQDMDDAYVTEWHTDGGDARWREIQGKPKFRQPKRHPK